MLKQGGISAAVSFLGKALVIPALLAGFAYVTPASAQMAPPPNPPGLTRGTGTHFSLPNSPYLPVTLDSNVSITLTLSSVPKIVDLMIFAGAADSADFTFGGFAPNTTYYRYMDNGLDPVEITTDSEGRYTYSQDLLKRHHVWFQERPSTYNLFDSDTDGDCNFSCTHEPCTSIGTWVAATKTCTLTTDVSQSIYIQGSGITLDGNGHKLIPSPYFYPVYSFGYNNVTIKGLGINNPYIMSVSQPAAIYVGGAGITVTKNTISDGYYGIMAFPPQDGFNLLTVTENIISDTLAMGIYSYYGDVNVDLNEISTTSSSGTGILSYSDYPGRTFITNNTVSGFSTGIDATSAENMSVRNNTISRSAYCGLSLGLVLNQDANDHVEVYNNNFVDNATSINYVGDDVPESKPSPSHASLAFHMEAPVGGNYFSDLHIASPSCQDTNSDGYCDVHTSTQSCTDSDSDTYCDLHAPALFIDENGDGFCDSHALCADTNHNGFCDVHTSAQFCSGIDSDGFCTNPFYIATASGYYFADLKDNLPWMTQDGWSSIPTNQQPTASAGGPYSVDEGTALVLSSANASDNELDPLTYSWHVDPGPCSFDEASINNPTLTCTDNGRFTVALVVSDNINAAVVSTATVTVNNVAPTAVFISSEKVNINRAFSLSLTSPHDPSLEDRSTGFQYAFDCGTGYGGFSGWHEVTCTAVSSIGGRTVKGKIQDKDNDVTEYTNDVEIIVNEPPTVTLPFASAEPSIVNQPVSVHAAFSDPGSTNSSFTCEVVYGDGSPAVSGWIDGFFCRTVYSQHAYLTAGTYTVTVSVTDDESKTGSETFQHTVTQTDITPPVIEPHGDVTAEATSADGANVMYDLPTAHDAYEGTIVPTCTPARGSTFALGTKTVTCNAKDSVPNEATPTTFVVTVVDKARPVIELHGNVTAEATSAEGATVNYELPATTDNVDASVTASCSPASGTFALGSTTVTCNANDEALNQAIPTTFVVTVVDTKPPVIAPHADVTVTSSTATIVFYDSPATSDIVDASVTASCSPESGSTFELGSTPVTCNATDFAGNPAIPTTFSVTVNDVELDTTPPVVTPPANVVMEATGLWTTVIVSATATDNVGVVSLSTAPTTFAVGVTTITWTATDAAGNIGTATSTVTVNEWTLLGFYQPVDMMMSSSSTIIWNNVKGGSTVPLKFEVFAGTAELRDVSKISSLLSKIVACSTGIDNPMDEEGLLTPTGGTELRYDATGDQFIYNWKTPKSPGICNRVTMTALDGSSLVAYFKFK